METGIQRVECDTVDLPGSGPDGWWCPLHCNWWVHDGHNWLCPGAVEEAGEVLPSNVWRPDAD